MTHVATFSVADIIVDASAKDPSKRVKVYGIGASCHMSPYIDAFTDFTYIEPRPIFVADNRTFKTVGKGALRITIPNGQESKVVHLRDVLYAPSIVFSLVSFSRADQAGHTTVIRDCGLHLLDRRNSGKVIGQIPVINGL